MKRYQLHISEPTVIARGDPCINYWGPYQFPHSAPTANGDLFVSWGMGNDHEAGGGVIKGSPNAVSKDGGLTWTPATEQDIRISDVKMRNGKYFLGFGHRDAFMFPHWDKHEKDIKCKGWGYRKVYLAKDLPEYTFEPSAFEYDPVTGETTRFPIQVKWDAATVTSMQEGYLVPVERTLSINNIVGTIEINGILYHCTYAMGLDLEGNLPPVPGYTNVYVLRSEDCGRTWEAISYVPFEEEFFKFSNCEGFNEPMMEQMPDGSVVMLMRSGDTDRPSYLTRSTDGCKTWSRPVQFDVRGVFPQIMTLDCGITLASYGRNGVWVRSTADPAGLAWETPIEIPLSPLEDPQTCPNHPPSGPVSSHRPSCCYTSLLPLDAVSALLIYTDFHYPTEDGNGFQKAVLTRKLTVELSEP